MYASWLRLGMPLFKHNMHIFTLCLPLPIKQFVSTSTMPSNNSREFAADDTVLDIADFRNNADEPAPIFSVHAAPCNSTNFHPSSNRIAGTDSQARCKATTAIKSQFTIVEPEVWNIFTASDFYGISARYVRFNISWNPLEHQTAPRKQSFDAQLYRSDREKVRLLLSHGVVCNFF